MHASNGRGEGGSGRLRHLSLPRDCVHHQPQLKLLLRPRQLKLLLLFISKVNFVLYHTSNNNSSTTREGWGDGGGRTVKSARHRMGNETFQRKRKLYTLRPGNFRCAVRRVNKVKQMEKQPQPATSSQQPLCATPTSAFARWFFFGNNCIAANNIFVIFCNTRGREEADKSKDKGLARRQGAWPCVRYTLQRRFRSAFLLLAQRSVRCTTFSAIVKRIKSMRQQKWKQKPAMITASSPGRLSAPLLCAGAGSGRAAIHCVCVCVSLVSQHGGGRGSKGRELETGN